MGKLFNRKKAFYSEDELEDEDIDEDLELEDDDDEEDDEDDEDEDDDDDDDDDDDEDDEDDDDDDDEDDDIDDEEDMDDDEESSQGGAVKAENRRSYRRKRRIRNQIIAYGFVIVLLAALIAAGFLAGQKISALIKEKRQVEEQDVAQIETEQEYQQEDMVIEAPPEVEEEVSMDDQFEELINTYVSDTPLEDKIAGLFITTPEALTGVQTVIQAGEGTQEALNEHAVGGLIYFSKNISDKEQLMTMLSNTVSMSKYPIFLAVDEEGGSVSRVADSDIEVIQVGDMADIGAGGDAAMAYEAGVTIGSYLKELGFNLDFAPVADVLAEVENEALGNRTFGTDAGVCSDMVSNIVEGMQGTGVSSCLKHFPGIGSVEGDTHDGKVETTRTLDEMRSSDFLPFQAGIAAGADFVMVSHITASAIDTEDLPSSLSKTMITDVLRGELGFDGIVITDALDMGAITDYYTSEEAAVQAITAGADMLLMPEDFEAAYNGLLTAVQDGRITEERIDESLRRIYRIKYADKLK